MPSIPNRRPRGAREPHPRSAAHRRTAGGGGGRRAPARREPVHRRVLDPLPRRRRRDVPQRPRAAHHRPGPGGRRHVHVRSRHAAHHAEPLRGAHHHRDHRVGGAGTAPGHGRRPAGQRAHAHGRRRRHGLRRDHGVLPVPAASLAALLPAGAHRRHHARLRGQRRIDLLRPRDRHAPVAGSVVPGQLHLGLPGPVRGPVARAGRGGGRLPLRRPPHGGGPGPGPRHQHRSRRTGAPS